MIDTKKSLGQHWLNDTASLVAMCDAANVSTGDTVLEIGPGTGTLTNQLVLRGARVKALEYDRDLIPSLEKKFADRVEIEQGDIRKFELSSLPKGYKIVANIPYYLSANLLRKLIDDPFKPSLTALLVQKEVAQRVAAQPNKMSFVAVATQLFYEVVLGELVPARLFTPPPKVDSQILILKLRPQPLVDKNSLDVFMKIVKAGFVQPRKKLISNLSGNLHLPKAEILDFMNQAQIDPDARAQDLSIGDWRRLVRPIIPSLLPNT